MSGLVNYPCKKITLAAKNKHLPCYCDLLRGKAERFK